MHGNQRQNEQSIRSNKSTQSLTYDSMRYGSVKQFQEQYEKEQEGS
jgi:hypothetical protein